MQPRTYEAINRLTRKRARLWQSRAHRQEKRIAELEQQVTRLQNALREQDKWWWESVGEGQAAHSDGQLTEQWGLHPGDLDPVKGEGDGA